MKETVPKKESLSEKLFFATLELGAVNTACVFLTLFIWNVTAYANSMNISYLESAKAIMGLSN